MSTRRQPTPQQWRHAREVFDACAELPPAERVRHIDAGCGDDQQLRLLVVALLRSRDLLGDTRDDHLARGIAAGVERIDAVTAPGERVGAFRIVRELARGGMGVVCLAERDDGTVAQRVALKFVGHAQLGPDATLQLAREYRLLAALEHPAIARLIDVGTRADGSAWFAMEYVEGHPITQHCDEHALTLRTRLALFAQVCAAVQYAHAHLIVHRDLKSANILVRADGLPKLLDFGIATSLGEQQAPGMAGFLSPQIAAPEQFDGVDASIATDVYALGVLLCELVAGRRPIELDGIAPNEAMRRVAEEPPRLPSRAADDESARRRGLVNAKALRRHLEGDLDAIAARCLEKEPQRRYASVAALADDVTRHLERRPLTVRAGERGHRAKRFVQRNAIGVALGSTVLALVTGFGILSALAAKELAHQRDQALQREREATFQQARAQAVSSFLVGLFKATTPEQRRGHDLTVRTLLERGRSELDRHLHEQPALHASMLAALSDVYYALDDLDVASELAGDAHALREPLAASDPVALRESLVQLARLDNQRARYREARDRIAQARSLLQESDASRDTDLLRLEAESLEGLGKPKEATPLLRAALDEERRKADNEMRTLRATMRLGRNLRVIGESHAAETLLSGVLQRARTDLPSDDPQLAETVLDLAILARNRNDLATAEPLANEALKIMIAIYGESSSQAASAMNNLAIIAQSNGRVDAARELFQRTLEIGRTIHGASSLAVARTEYNLGLLLQLRTRDAAGALTHLQAALEIDTRLLPPEHVGLANVRLALGSTLRELGRYAEAEAMLEKALPVFEAAAAPRGLDIALTRGELACAKLVRAADTVAAAQLDAAIAALRSKAADDPQAQRVFGCRAKRAGTVRRPGPAGGS